MNAYPSPSRPGVWLVRSERGVATYTVQVADGRGICDCQGFRRYGRPCKHIRKVLEMTNGNHEAALVDEHEPAAVDESRALVPITVQPPAVTLPTVDEVGAMKAIAASVINAKGHAVPASLDSPEKAFAVMLAGWELGVKPMTALRHVFCVNGRTEPDAQLMMGIVRAAEPGAEFIFHRYDERAVKVELRRHKRASVTVEYTIEDAERSRQIQRKKVTRDGRTFEVDGPWQLYTRDMLAWSAVKRACRLGAPDLINAIVGVAVAETLEAEVVEESAGEPVAQVAPPAAAPRGFADESAAAPLPAEQQADVVQRAQQAAARVPRRVNPQAARESLEEAGFSFVEIANVIGVEPKSNQVIEAGIRAWLEAEPGRTVTSLAEAVAARKAQDQELQPAPAAEQPPIQEEPPAPEGGD